MEARWEAWSTSDALANEAEESQIAEMRRELTLELEDLRQRGVDFLHTTGDVFFLRVLRGNAHDVAESCRWYRGCLVARREHGLDELYLRLRSQGVPLKFSFMPHAAKIAKNSHIVFDEHWWRTKSGDLLFYDGLGRFDTRTLVRDVGWEGCKEFLRAMLERRLAAVDEMSRTQRRLVKVVRIFDCAGTSIWSYDKEFLDFLHREIDPVSQRTQLEVVRSNFYINTPWFGEKIFGILKGRLPLHIQQTVHLLGRNYMEDPEVRSLGAGALQRLTDTSFDAWHHGLPTVGVA